MLLGNRKANRHQGSLAGNSGNAYFASDQTDTLTHTQKAKRRRIELLGFGNSSAIVTDREDQGAFVFLKSDIDFRGARVAHNVRQGFLKNTEHSSRLRLIQAQVFDNAIAISDDAGAVLKLLRVPSQRRGQT